MEKHYFKNADDVKFLEQNHWLLNEEKGCWVSWNRLELYPKPNETYNDAYEIRVPFEKVNSWQCKDIATIYQHQFGARYTENNFIMDMELWIDWTLPYWEHRMVKFTPEMAYEFILDEGLADMVVPNIYDADVVESIHNTSDLKEYVDQKEAVDFCERLYLSKSKSILEWIGKRYETSKNHECVKLNIKDRNGFANKITVR